MKALVTGGSGYFGSLLVKRLHQSGAQVGNFDLNPAHDLPRDVIYFPGDIRDRTAIAQAAVDMDVIFHNVAQVPLAKDRDLFWSVNRDGMVNTLRAAKEAGVRKVVYISSSAVFGIPKTNPVTEETAPAPAEDYGKAKFEAEKICEEWNRAQGLDVSIVRPRTILGSGRLGIFQILFEWIVQGYNVPVLGDGKNLYQFVDASDLAEACILAAHRPGFAKYNCGAEVFGTMREGLEDLCRFSGTGSKVTSCPKWLAVGGMKLTSALGLSPLGPYHSLMYGESLYFDISKAKRELNWQPKHSNAQMLRMTYSWYVEKRAEILSSSNMSLHRSPVKQGVLKFARYFF